MTLYRIAMWSVWALALAVIAALVIALSAVFDPQPYVVNERIGAVSVRFQVDHTLVLFPGDCVGARWDVENARAVGLNLMERDAEDSQIVCGANPVLNVVLDDGRQDYPAEIRAVFGAPVPLLLLLVVLAVPPLLVAYRLNLTSVTPLQCARSVVRRLDALAFHPPQTDALARGLRILALALLFLLGVFHWLYFYNLGNLDLDAHDWGLTSAYHNVIRQAMDAGEAPFFVDRPLRYVDRFLANPDVPHTPQILLLPALAPGRYALFDTLIFYTLGFAGSLLIARRYRLSLAAFGILFALFNFNGYITAQLAIGHSMWNGYFLLIFFVYYLLQLVEGEHPLRTALKLALVFLLLALEGAVHMVIWCSFVLGILGIFNRRLLAPVALAIGAGFLLAAYRYIPTVVSYTVYDEFYRTGFPTLNDLLDGLTVIRDYTWARGLARQTWISLYSGLQWWEFDVYIGWAGLAFIAFFGVVQRFSKRLPVQDLRYAMLDLPVAVMIILSLGTVYSVIYNLPLPLVDSERVTSRLIIVPLLILLVIGCIRASRLLPELAPSLVRKFIVLALLAQTTVALFSHSDVWNIRWLELEGLAPTVPAADIRLVPLSARELSGDEQFYVTVFGVSIVISLIVIVACLALYLWTFRPPAPVEPVAETELLDERV